MSGVITSYNWTRWASIFGNSGFEIYKNTTKTYTIKEIYNVIGRFAKHILKIYKALDNIKTWFFELDKLMASFIPKQKD